MVSLGHGQSCGLRWWTMDDGRVTNDGGQKMSNEGWTTDGGRWMMDDGQGGSWTTDAANGGWGNFYEETKEVHGRGGWRRGWGKGRGEIGEGMVDGG